MKMRSLAIITSALLFTIAVVLIVDRASQGVVQMIKEKNEESTEQSVPAEQQNTQRREANPNNPHSTAMSIPSCRRTFDRNFVADELGRVCPWNKLDHLTGCCPGPEIETPVQEQVATVETCQFCALNCCSIYAYCISCCLRHAMMTDNAGKFDNCMAACRTSSVSVVNEKEWKSPLKYCFPKDGNFQGHPPKPHDNRVESFPKDTTITGRSATIPEDEDNPEKIVNSTSATNNNLVKDPEKQVPKTDQNVLVVTLQEQVSKLLQEKEHLTNQIEQLSSVLQLQLNQSNNTNSTENNRTLRSSSGDISFASFLVILIGFVVGFLV